MAQVPYTGTLDAQPQLDPLTNVHVDTPIAAFGGTVAQAVEHLGDVAQGAGKELFDRAYAMQSLHVQDQANADLANFQNEMTQQFDGYRMKQGKDAIDALPGFMKQTDELRQRYADKQTSPEGQFLFNQESRQSRFRIIFAASNYANEEMKKFSVESGKMRQDGIANEAAAAASQGNMDGVSEAAKKAGALGRRMAEEKGLDPESAAQAEREGRSRVTSSVARELIKTNPLAGEKFVQDKLRSGDMTDVDAQNLHPMVQHQKLMVGTRVTGNEVLSGNAPEWDSVKVGSARGLEILHKSSGTGGYETIGPEDKDGNGHAIGQYGIPSSELSRWLRDAGMPAMSEDAFLKDHAAQDQLAKFKIDELQSKYGNIHEALKVWTSGIDTNNRTQQGRKAVADTAGHVEIANVADRAAQRVAPGDGMFSELTKDHIETTTTRNERFLEQDQRHNTGILDDALMGVGRSDGKLPTSVPELRAISPQVDDAYGKLDPNKSQDARIIHAINKTLQNNINHGGFEFTIQSQAQFERLHGISSDPYSTVAERKELLDLSPGTQPWPLEARQRIREDQKRIATSAAAEPSMKEALSLVQPMLQAYGMTKELDKDRYLKFVGAFHDALQGYGIGQAKKVSTPEEIMGIGSRILREMPKAHFWNQSTRYFETPPADNAAMQMATSSLTKTLGRPPTQEEVARVLLRSQFEAVSGNLQKLDNK